jgi:type IV fimbrial biogenesis protein FimT
MQPSKSSSAAGFTLIGLVISIAIAAILAMLLVSAVGAAAAKVNAGVAEARLVTSLERARTIAISGDSDIVMCPSSDGTHCSAGDHWESGWIGFADRGENGQRNDDEPIILREVALAAGMHLVSTKGRTHLRFQAVFGGNGGSNVTFTFCDTRGPRAAKSWVLANNGRLHSTPAKPANIAAACADG